jgi:hypothetical protein
MSFEDAIAIAREDDRFKATVYAMNSLLQARGIYTREEFEAAFVQWVEKDLRAKKRALQSTAQSAALA